MTWKQQTSGCCSLDRGNSKKQEGIEGYYYSSSPTESEIKMKRYVKAPLST